MHYKELRIYQIADRLRKELHEELNKIEHHWNVVEVKQSRRSSSSIVSNIVEGHGRRFYPKDYYRFLDISMASSDETQDHVKTLGTKHHFNKARASYFEVEYKGLSIKNLKMMNSIKRRYKF
jgi:four helix bundle protein